MGYYDDLLKNYRDRNGTTNRDNVPEDPKKYGKDYYSNLLNDFRSGKPLNFTQPQPIQVQSKVHYGGPTVAQAREAERQASLMNRPTFLPGVQKEWTWGDYLADSAERGFGDQSWAQFQQAMTESEEVRNTPLMRGINGLIGKAADGYEAWRKNYDKEMSISQQQEAAARDNPMNAVANDPRIPAGTTWAEAAKAFAENGSDISWIFDAAEAAQANAQTQPSQQQAAQQGGSLGVFQNVGSFADRLKGAAGTALEGGRQKDQSGAQPAQEPQKQPYDYRMDSKTGLPGYEDMTWREYGLLADSKGYGNMAWEQYQQALQSIPSQAGRDRFTQDWSNPLADLDEDEFDSAYQASTYAAAQQAFDEGHAAGKTDKRIYWDAYKAAQEAKSAYEAAKGTEGEREALGAYNRANDTFQYIASAMPDPGSSAFLKGLTGQTEEYRGMAPEEREDYAAQQQGFADAADYRAFTSVQGQLRAATSTGASFKSVSDNAYQAYQNALDYQAQCEADLNEGTAFDRWLNDEQHPERKNYSYDEAYEEFQRETQQNFADAVKQTEYTRTVYGYAKAAEYADLQYYTDWADKVAAGREQWQKEAEAIEQSRRDTYGQLTSGAGDLYVTPYEETIQRDGYSYTTPIDGHMTEGQKDIWYYLVANGRREEAEQYAYACIYRNMAEKDAAWREEQEAWGAEHPGLSVAASLVTFPFGAWDRMAQWTQYLDTGHIMPQQETGYTPAQYSDTWNSGLAKELNEWSGTLGEDFGFLSGKGAGDALLLGESMLQSISTAWMGGGAVNALFYFNAAAEGTRDALSRGSSEPRAILYGCFCGAAEVAGETLSVENLLNMDKSLPFLRKLLRQGGVEMSEEAVTDILERAGDEWANGQNSKFQQRRQELLEKYNGDYDRATKEAWAEWWSDVAFDALGGFISGGMSAPIYTAGGKVGSAVGSWWNNNMTPYQGDLDALLETAGLAESSMKGSDRRLLDKVRGTAENAKTQDRTWGLKDNGGSISNRTAEKLRGAALKAINRADLATLSKNVTDKLKVSFGEQKSDTDLGKMAKRIVDAAMKAVNGEESRSSFGTAIEQKVYEELVMQLEGETPETGGWLDLSTLKSTQAQQMALDRAVSTVKVDGEEAKVTKAVMEDGALKLEVERNGETQVLSQDEIELTDYQKDALDTLTRVLGNDAAAVFNNMTNEQKLLNDFGLQDVAISFGNIMTNYGTAMTTENQEKIEKAALASSLRRGLTDGQVLWALKLGQQKATQIRSELQGRRGTGAVSTAGATLKDTKGNTITLNALKNPEAALKSKKGQMITGLAKALRVNIVLYDGGNGVVNGAYQDGTIYLDWSTLQSDDTHTADWAMFRVLSHELTHHLKATAKSEYKELQKFITDYLAESKNLNFNDLVHSKMVRETRPLSYEDAVDEVIADACETMLGNSKYVQELAQKKPNLFQKIWNWMRHVFRRIEASDEAAKELQPVMDRVRELWDKALKASVEGGLHSETEAQAELGVEVATNSQGQTTAVVAEGTGNMQLSIKTYEDDGKLALSQFLDTQMKKQALTKDEAKEIREQLDRLYKICKQYDDGRYAPFSAWSNASVVTRDGRPVFSVVKKNNEYKLNLDFSLVCKKRRTLDAVFNEMIRMGIMDDFKMVQESIVKINDIIREHEFETACGLCFVDAKRYLQGAVASQFTMMWNNQVRSLLKPGQKLDYFNFGGDETLQNTGDGIDTLSDDDLDWTKIDEILRTEGSGTVKYRIADNLKNHPENRKLVQRGDFMSTAGFDALSEKAPDIMKLYNSKKGTGGPKAVQSDVQYLNEVINQGMFNEEAAYAVGGVRIQSFSDYVGRMVFDYVQMVADLAAKKLPAHSYTKEYLYALQFGLTGIKINMSLVPEVIKGGVAAGLDANGNYAWKDGQSFGSTVYDNKGKRLTAAEGFELAKRIQNADGYSKNCGTIAVGVSDAHILKMLDDPDIKMVIPYHKSSLNHILAVMMDIDKYDDYTLFQSTRKWNGSKWVKLTGDETNLKKVDGEWVKSKGDFNYNEALQRLGDARAAANEYLEWCEKNGYSAKFSDSKGHTDFSKHENYYKLLEDFSCYDRDGTTNTPLSAVQMNFPTADSAFGSMSDLIQQGLEEDAILQAKQDKAVPEIIKDIQAVLPEFEAGLKAKGKKKAAVVDGSRAQLSTKDTIRREDVVSALWESMDHADKGDDNLISAGKMPKFIRELTGIDGDLYLYRNHIFENMSDEESAEAVGRGNEDAHFHGYDIDEMADIIMSIDNPLMSFKTWNKDGNPTMIELLPYYGKTGAPLYAVISFYANKPINGVYTKKPHIVLTIAERPWVQSKEDGRASLTEVVDNAIKQDRVLSFSDEMRAELSVNAAATSYSIITDSALMKNVSQFRKEINSFKQANKINYSVKSDAKTDRELLKAAYQDMLAMKQWAIENLKAEQKKALEDFRKAVDRYESKEREVTAALDELDKLVQVGDDPKAVQAARAKVSAKEEQLASALDKLTKSMNGSEIQQILQQERRIERQRTRDSVKETVNRKGMRRRVEQLWKELNKRVLSPTEKKHIPPELIKQTIDVLQALNMDTSREGSQAGEKLRAKLLDLKERYNQLKTDPDFDSQAVYDPFISEMLDRMVEVVGDTPINKLSAKQLEVVYETLKAMEHTARQALKVKLGEIERSAYEASLDMTRETRSVAKPKTGLLAKWVDASLSPERMFNRLGNYHKNSVWSQVYRMLDAGQLKQTQLQMEGSMIFDGLTQGKDYEKFLNPKNTVDIGLKDENGNAIHITHGMMVSLYMHLLNEQNLRHVAWGGLTIPALKEYYNGKKAKGSEKAVRVGGALQEIADIKDRLYEAQKAGNEAEVATLEGELDAARLTAEAFVYELRDTIEKQLTDYDRQWIAACKELFDGFSKRVLNETTMEVYGIKRANVENYFPIWVDGDFLSTPFETVAHDFSLENAGFMKERQNSSKPIRLADVSDVAASQIRKVSQYAGLMPAIRNFNKIWGKTQTGFRDSLRKAVHEKFGDDGVKYIENLMSDLNGARGQGNDAGTEFFNRMRGRMAQASLTMSARVALGQAASYPTAASAVGWKALHKALWRGGKNNWMFSKADQELIRKWSPLLYYRMKGYANTELGDIAGMNDKLTRVWKKAKWLTGWIQAMDGATVGRLWYAAEYWVQDNRKDLTKGTDAYYEEVAKKFNEIVELTQPNYTTMQRPDILRNPNALVKQLTMFMTQRLQNFNILYDALATHSQMRADYKAGVEGVTKEDVKQAAAASRTAVLSQVAAAATITAFKFLADVLLHSWKAYRDKDEQEITAESVGMELLDMFIDSLAGNFLWGGEAYDIVEKYAFGKTYYGIEVSSISSATDLVSSAMTVFDHVANGKFSKKDLDTLARKLGTFTGIPYANAMKFVDAGRFWIEDAKSGEWLINSNAGVDRTTAQQASRLYRAYTEMDGARVKKILEEVPEDKRDTLYQAVRALIKEQYKSGEITVYEAMRQMDKYGGASAQTMANFIKDEYKAGNLLKDDAVKYLMEYAGRSRESAEKTIRELGAEKDTGIKYDDISDQYLAGNLTLDKAMSMREEYGNASDESNISFLQKGFEAGKLSGTETVKALVQYAGAKEADAQNRVDFWTYKKDHPETNLDYTNYKTWLKTYKPLGLTDAQYDEYEQKMTEATNGGSKDDVFKIVNGLHITSAQKERLLKETREDMIAIIKADYADGTISRSAALSQLVKYGGKDQESAEKVMRDLDAKAKTGYSQASLDGAYALGEINRTQAVNALVQYGLDKDKAETRVKWWDYREKNPNTKLTEDSYTKYLSDYKPIGLSAEQYEDYASRLKDCKGVDADGDGKTDSGSKKTEVVALIDSLDLTPEQKDQLYLANNYAQSGLKDAPWHK